MVRLICRPEPTRYWWHPAENKLQTEKPAEPTHSFLVRDLTFWQWQEVLAEQTPETRHKVAFRLALLDVDEDATPEVLTAFVERPTVAAFRIVNALYALLDGAAEGN